MDGRPNRRNNAAFSNFSGAVRWVPESIIPHTLVMSERLSQLYRNQNQNKKEDSMQLWVRVSKYQ